MGSPGAHFGSKLGSTKGLRKEEDDTTKKMLNMQVRGKIRRGGPRRDG